jgi:hypothetical protein
MIRSGDLGEILATEYVAGPTDSSVPIKRLSTTTIEIWQCAAQMQSDYVELMGAITFSKSKQSVERCAENLLSPRPSSLW